MLSQSETRGRRVYDRLAYHERSCRRWRGNIENMQYLAGRHKLKIVDQGAIGLESLRPNSRPARNQITFPYLRQ